MHFYVDFELLLALLTYSYPFRQIYSLNHYYWIALMLDKVARFDIKEAHPFFAHFHCIYGEYFGILDDFWMIFMRFDFLLFDTKNPIFSKPSMHFIDLSYAD